ncbi:elongation factor Ts [Patescibacteria group bacterium]|nr:elongation factor Ts [Patescibacteria group bacterium]
MISIDQIKQLRKETGISLAECKKALEESKGNIILAKEILRKWGKGVAEKKAERTAKEGIIESYIHSNKKIGTLLQISCESDFVAKSEEFKNLAHELCLQITALNPLFLTTDEITEEFLGKEKKIYQEQLKNSGKPKKIIDEIVNEKLEKYKTEISLLSQTWIKDEKKNIKELIDEYIAKLGENIVIRMFVRYEI